ncbi:uncharacterized protein LOC112095135, partial [Morus notabilis]|uniref:uncharacterized protein LOC112095135 n=1 Tax=Morus notabilis TaxID=981085 RepID=UPI000CED734F
MTLLNLSYHHHPWLSHLSHPSLLLPLPLPNHFNTTTTSSTHTLLSKTLTLNLSKTPRTRASLGESETSSSVAENSVSELLDAELLNQVSAAKDAEEALQMIAGRSDRNGGVVGTSDCQLIISAALDRNNLDLALSVFYAMRASFDQGVAETGTFFERWKWSRPDVRVYTSLVQGLAASLRVSDALRIINNICQVGVSPAEE